MKRIIIITIIGINIKIENKNPKMTPLKNKIKIKINRMIMTIIIGIASIIKIPIIPIKTIIKIIIKITIRIKNIIIMIIIMIIILKNKETPTIKIMNRGLNIKIKTQARKKITKGANTITSIRTKKPTKAKTTPTPSKPNIYNIGFIENTIPNPPAELMEIITEIII